MTITPPKAILLIRNPIAGRRRRGLVDAVVRQVRTQGWTVDLVDTEALCDARRLAETCDAARYGVIAVAGGDGTINEVVSGLGDADVALAILPFIWLVFRIPELSQAAVTIMAPITPTVNQLMLPGTSSM